MSLSTQGNTSDATKLIGNILGNAASWSSSSDIRRAKNSVKEDNGNDRTNTHLAMSFSEIIQYCKKKPQNHPTRSNQLSGQVLISQP